MWGVLLPLAVVGFIAGSTAQAQQTITNTTTYPFFNSLTVCAPINVLISESTDGKYTLTVDADPEVQEALVISYSGGVGIGIETEGDFQSSNPIKITLAMPPGALQYIELDYTNSDVAIDVPFDKLKGEIANNGNGNVIVTRGMDGALAKISTVGSGTVMARGAATYTELFSAGSGNRYLTGFQGQINIKHDGSGSVGVSPASGGTNIAGVNTGSGPVAYANGNCTVRKDPDAGPPKVGDACAKVNSISIPPQMLNWTCGISVKGNYNCGGPGFDGPPTLTTIPCSTSQNNIVMLSTANYF